MAEKRIKGGHRTMKKCLYIIVPLLLITSLFAQQVRRGLSTKFSEVILSGLKPGMVYSIKKEENLPYKVMNLAEKDVHVEVAVEKPSQDELREGYEPVPDVSWVKVFPTVFHLKPGESTNCDVIIAIPDDEKYTNRHFQVMLITQTVEKPGARGVATSLGVKSRLRFSTGPTPEKVMEEYRNKVLEVLKIDVIPLSLFLSEVPVGKRIKLDGKNFSTLQIINRGREDYKVEFQVAKNPERYGLTTGYVAMPEEIGFKFRKKKIESKKRSISDVTMELEVPDREEFYGKSFAFVVVVKILSLDIPVELFSRVYFKTEQKNEKKQ